MRTRGQVRTPLPLGCVVYRPPQALQPVVVQVGVLRLETLVLHSKPL